MPKPWEKYKGDIPLIEIPGRAASNFPKDALRVGKDIASVIGSPLDALHSMSGVLTGAANLAFPEGFPELTYYGHGAVTPTTGVEEARAVGGALKEDYGGYENIKRTLADKPAQSLIDIVTLVSGVSAALSKVPGIAGRIGRVAAAPGRAIAKAPGMALHRVSKSPYRQSMTWQRALGSKGHKPVKVKGTKTNLQMAYTDAPNDWLNITGADALESAKYHPNPQKFIDYVKKSAGKEYKLTPFALIKATD
jgi:hypothetical protein